MAGAAGSSSTTTRLSFLLSRGSSLVMLPQGSLAMRTIGCVVACLTIAHEVEDRGYAQVRARQHDRQPHQDLGHGQRRGFVLTSVAAGPESDAPKTSASCGDASRATCASHSDPSRVHPWPLQGPSPLATATP